MTDCELLARYATTGCEDSFRQFVERYLALVEGVVRRKAGRDDLAGDVAMEVFAAAAKKANRLSRRKSVGGWLVLAARLETTERLRKEDIRHRHMKRFAEDQMTSAGAGEAEWEKSLPLLDDALASLSEGEREAVVLRFYQVLPYREIGSRLGRGEDASRKLVNRALERMSRFFRRRQIALPAAALAAGLGAQLTKAHAGGLVAATLAKGALASAAAAKAAPLLTLSYFTIMSSAKKIALAAALVLLCAGGAFQAGKSHGATRRAELASIAERTQLETPVETKPTPIETIPAPPPLHPAKPSLRERVASMAQAHRETKTRPSAFADLRRLTESIARGEHAEALAILDADFAGDSEVRRVLGNMLVVAWAKHDGRSACEEAMRRAAPNALESFLFGTLPNWARYAPHDAQAWLAQHANDLGEAVNLRLRGIIFQGWVEGDPVGGLDALEALPFDEQRAASALLWTAVRNEEVRPVFLDRLSRVKSERLRGEIFDRSVADALDKDAGALATTFDQLAFTDPDRLWNAADRVAGLLYKEDPAKAASWLWERVPETMRQRVLNEYVFAGWSQKDRVAVAAWLTDHGYEAERMLREVEARRRLREENRQRAGTVPSKP